MTLLETILLINNKNEGEYYKMKNYEKIFNFDVTFFSADIRNIKKAHKILKGIKLSSRIKDEEVNYDLVVKSAANFACTYGRDEEFIKELRERCFYESNRIRTNSISNSMRVKCGKKMIESDTVTIGIRDNCINNLYAIMKNQIQIDNLTLETLLHTITLYYSERVINSYEKRPNKRFKNNSQIRKEAFINSQEREATGHFRTLKDVIEEKMNKVEEDTKQDEEDTKQESVIVTKRDKKKLQRQINNIAHNIVFEDLLQEEQDKIQTLRDEREALIEEIKRLHIERENSILTIKKAKEQLKNISEIFITSSLEAEDNSNSIDVDNSFNEIMLKRIISARKMRGMNTKQQEEKLTILA